MTFIDRDASVKRLALSFLMLIGILPVADDLDFREPRGDVDATMGFLVVVDALDLLAANRR